MYQVDTVFINSYEQHLGEGGLCGLFNFEEGRAKRWPLEYEFKESNLGILSTAALVSVEAGDNHLQETKW